MGCGVGCAAVTTLNTAVPQIQNLGRARLEQACREDATPATGAKKFGFSVGSLVRQLDFSMSRCPHGQAG